MARKERKIWIIYPEYFDTRLTRSERRRVPKNLAVNSPDIDEISEVLDSFDIPNRVEKHKHHPHDWYEKRGRIIINKQGKSKEEFLKDLAKSIKLKRQRS
ncbi:MAG: signal recognition particle subunit SRP19/SEC65 family protein [Thermoplasmatota archaeon]